MLTQLLAKLCFGAVLLLMGSVIWASEYAPDLLELSGDAPLALKPKGELSFVAGGTVEFWVSPGWQQQSGAAPVIIASRSANGLNFAVAMSATKDRLFVYAGEHSAAIDFPFGDGDMHHVVVASLDNVSKVLIDGALVASLGFVFLPDPSETLWVGGLSKTESLFSGALAQLRVWDTPLVPQELVDYAMTDVQAVDAPHPSLGSLRVKSNFNARGLTLIPIPAVPVEFAGDLEQQ